MKDQRPAHLRPPAPPHPTPRTTIDDPGWSQVAVGLELGPNSTIDLFETADALERWVRQRVVTTGQRIALSTEHHAHDGATALRVSVPAAWTLDAKTGRAGLAWSLRGRGVGVKPAHDVLGSVFVTAVGAARLLHEHDGVHVRADELEVEVDDRRQIEDKKEVLIAVAEELGGFLGALFRGTEVALETEHAHPGGYRVRVHADPSTNLTTLIAGLHRLAAERTALPAKT